MQWRFTARWSSSAEVTLANRRGTLLLLLTSRSYLRLSLAVCALGLGCGGQAQTQGDEPKPEPPPAPHAVQEAAEGLEMAQRALCACQESRSATGECDADDFEGYDREAVRETLVRHAERGDGFTECVRDIVQRLSACLSAEHGCDRGACPDAAALLDDSNMLAELSESCPGQ